jgi:hypothetical protein
LSIIMRRNLSIGICMTPIITPASFSDIAPRVHLVGADAPYYPAHDSICLY